MSATISGVILQLLVTVLIGIVLFFVGNRIIARRSGQAGSKTTTTGDLARLARGLNTTSGELDKILEKIELNRKKPKTKSKWQERLEQMQEQQKKMKETQQKSRR